MADLATNFQDNSRDKIGELNAVEVATPQEAVEILKELNTLKGKLIKGSVLEKSIENYLGEMDIYGIDSVIEALENFQKKVGDEFNTSEVPIAKIQELVEDYEKYTEKSGLNNEKAIDKIYKENNGAISRKNIEQFVQRQKEIYEETLKKINEQQKEKASEKVVDLNKYKKEQEQNEIKAKVIAKEKIIKEERLKQYLSEDKAREVNDKIFEEIIEPKKNENSVEEVIDESGQQNSREIIIDEFKDTAKLIEAKIKIENQVNETSNRILEDLKSDENLREVLKNKEIEHDIGVSIQENSRKIIRGESNQNNKNTTTDFIKGIGEVLEENNVPGFKQEIIERSRSVFVKNVLEVNRFVESNKTEINEVRKEDLKESIIDSFSDKTLSNIKKEDVKKYAAFVSEVSFVKGKIDIERYKSEVISHAESQNISPGKIENGWINLESLTNVLNSPQKIDDLLKTYNGLAKNIGGKIPVNIKECDKLDSILKKASGDTNFKNLIDSFQKKFGSGSGFLGFDKFASKILGTMGEGFLKDSLVILSEKGFEQGSFIILQSFIGGGAGALGVTAATITSQAAAAALIEANAALVAANLAVETATAALAATTVGTAAEIAATAALATATATATAATTTAATAAVAAETAAAALATATATAGGTAAAVGTAAVSGMVPVVGWIVAGVIAITTALKPLFDKVKNFMSSMGLNLTAGVKDFLSDNFGIVGKFVSWVINLTEDVLILIGGAITAVIGGTSVVIFVIIGLFGYQLIQGSMISSMVPPIFDPTDDGSIITNQVPLGDLSFSVPTVASEFTREELVNIAKSILGLPYFWGGKYNQKGANPNWGKLMTVTAAGSRNTGNKIPYGLDCSGYVDWVYYQLTGKVVGGGGGAGDIYRRSTPISESELLPGDVGYWSGKGGEHIGLYIGRDTDGTPLFIQETGSSYGDSSKPNGQVMILRLRGQHSFPFQKFGRPKVTFKS